jgi:hypothetical protein
MSIARRDRPAAGLTPVYGLTAAPVEEAKQDKFFQHDRLTLRRLCELFARLCGLERVDADVARADRYVAMLTAARLARRLGELEFWEVLCGALIRFINASDLVQSERDELQLAVLSYSIPTFCEACEFLAGGVSGFRGLQCICSGSCPCMAAPAGVLVLNKPAACGPAYDGAFVPDTACVEAWGVELEEAPMSVGLPVIGSSASSMGIQCDGVAGFVSPVPVFIASSAPDSVPARAAPDPCAELSHDTPAIELSSCAVTETSALQPVGGVHFATVTFGVSGTLVDEQGITSMDTIPEASVELPVTQPGCEDGVPCEEAGDGLSPATEAAVDVCEPCGMTPSWLLAMIQRSWYPDPTAAVVSICLVGAESSTATAVSSMAGLVKQEAFPMVHPVESLSPVCPSSDFSICAPSSGCMGAALEVSAASTLRASAACTSLEWVAAVPAATATVRAVLSVSLAAEILQTLRQAVVCIALANSVRGALTVSDSMAVEDIHSGCDPPVVMVC